MKTRYLLVFVVCCDVLMFFVGIPLERATWLAIAHHVHDRHVLVGLLAANVGLFALCVGAFFATALASTRGVQYALRRFSRAYARPR